MSTLATSLLLVLVVSACGTGDNAGASGDKTLTVFAAASLTNAFASIGTAFEEAHSGVSVEFNFAGSQTLATQLSEGAAADVFAAANTLQMDRASEAGVVGEDPQIFAFNQLVIIVPAGNPAGLDGMFGLGDPDLKLVVAAPEVPAGAYAQDVLDRLADAERLRNRFPDFDGFNVVSNEINVLQVVTRVRLGEADAGIVYATDITPNIASQLQVIEILDEFNVQAAYPIVPVSGGDAELAADFIDFVLSPEGQQILTDWGFLAASS